MSNNGEFMKGYALGKAELSSTQGVIRNLVSLVNEHTFLLMALMKKLGTNPQELLESLNERDFINDADAPKPDGGPSAS